MFYNFFKIFYKNFYKTLESVYSPEVKSNKRFKKEQMIKEFIIDRKPDI